MADSFEELEKELEDNFKESSENPDDISVFHDAIWPGVIKCENYFRKTQDIRALEQEAGLLLQMGDNIFMGAYFQDAYVVCKRILDIDPTREAAEHTIKDHILPFFQKDYSFLRDTAKTEKEKTEIEKMIEDGKNPEPRLKEYYEKCKKDNFENFSDENSNIFNSQGSDFGEK